SSTIAIYWILRYPAKMQADVDTTNPKHLREFSQAANFSLTRKEWYEIYLAAVNNLP
ncbi:aldo/keto reductase family oxidoreductase, partial [Streptococcus pneumoniae]